MRPPEGPILSSELDHQVHRSVPTWYKPFQSKKWVLTKKFDLTTLLVHVSAECLRASLTILMFLTD